MGHAARRPTRPRSSWDLLCLLGMWLVGLALRRRPARRRRSRSPGSPGRSRSTSSSSNTNDMIQPALLLFGLLLPDLAASLRGAFGVLGGAGRSSSPLLLLPLWSGYPDARDRRSRPRVRRSARSSPRRRRSRSSSSTPSPWHARTRLLPPHVRLPVRPRLAVLALGLGPVPREGPARPALAAARPAGRARRRRARALPLAAPPLAAAARRVHGRAARRLRDGADPLVVPLPAVVLPVRRVRAALALAARSRRVQDEPYAATCPGV